MARSRGFDFVTGTPGDAGLALAILQDRLAPPNHSWQATCLQARLDKPSPRIRQGLELRGLASAAIDISDGLAQDLGHILECSDVGARLLVNRLPLSPAATAYGETAIAMSLAGGMITNYALRHRLHRQSVSSTWRLTGTAPAPRSGSLRLNPVCAVCAPTGQPIKLPG
ncbi:MAG: hypothetical protein R3F37_00580 [Candidatus Competibacteraceae bacterium]